MISEYCRKRIAEVLPPRETESIRQYLIQLLDARVLPPRFGVHVDWSEIALEVEISADVLRSRQKHLAPVFDAVTRALSSRGVAGKSKTRFASRSKGRSADEGSSIPSVPNPRICVDAASSRKRRTYKQRPIVEFPEPLWTEWEEPATFGAALKLQSDRHGDRPHHLFRALRAHGHTINRRTVLRWIAGDLIPRSVSSFAILRSIEHRYRLPEGYFRAKLPHPGRALTGHVLEEFSASERRRLVWHLPDDFNSRPFEEQEEIIAWVRNVIISGSTEYRKYQAAAMRSRYAVRFAVQRRTRQHLSSTKSTERPDDLDKAVKSNVIDAPPELEQEMADLLDFKTSTLTAFGYQRNGVWNDETASQKVEHLGLLFGALTASPRSSVRGFGADLSSMCFALLIFPSVWDWYLQWRERRRGFYTNWEVDMLSIAIALVKEETGWLRQNPSLACRLTPIPGLVSDKDILSARNDWDAACAAMHKHGRNRIKEIQRVARVHRDPFEPILAILEADSPVGEYRKITDEILRLMPDERRYPRSAAEAVRSFLLLRLGLHLGLRQRNLRELRVCPKGASPASERQLEDMRCGELRWSVRENGWEVFIPAIAFKNATSSFFGSKPFRLILPDLGNLYEMIECYLDRHRQRLLGPAADPQTFFVKTAKRSSTNAAYNQDTFYEAWRLTIQRYGIYNPYTKRGAILGLLPHGPHNIRDVLATHILKKTGSYEQASYAIQDTPDMVAKHYGRFLPQDKSAIAAQILNRVWEVV